ncbi:putative F-box/LRR-repeat protein At5g02700 [Cucurbita moschata]|uniref:F-box/LRR-repeat protein At5g02700 n=1 Tax=Cucurbita moschata TaxID=3662 RepID=A0A6J1GUZ5_CUCMO|nr:putative F-box/LRR-repeat protein At5g02700 [Cucurbita moschata]XP_022955933.1 putative F-box/LRR-repeat protein At5g02700 [Cucurbita moschata]
MDDEQTKHDGLTLFSRVPFSRRKRKRNDIENIDGIKKKQNKGVKTVEQEIESVDMISELPESVIHHILSFIRSAKEAARMSILSKKWRDAWKSFSILTFDEQSFLKTEVDLGSDQRRQMFINSIDNSLLSHLTRNFGIYKLVFRVTPKLILYLNRWVGIAGANGLGELDIRVEKSPRHYIVPPFMNSIKTLTGLRLHGLKWSSFAALEFNNLRKLYLRRLYVDQQMIEKLASTSPLIMDLRIVECRGLKNLQISGFRKLERVDMYQCHGLRRVELQVTSLNTFWFCAKNSSRCKLNLESCTSLKRLTLENPSMTDTFLNKLLFNFPVLEKLILSRCNKLKHIEISNVKLRSLGLRSCNNLKIVDIGTVNPCSLDYKGHKMVFMLGQLCLKEANFSFGLNEKDGAADIPCRNLVIHSFLRYYCEGFTIIVWFHKNIIIHDESKDILLPPLPHLKLHVIKSSTDPKDLLDGLLTTWHPERIIVVSSPSSDVPKALHKIKGVGDPSYCGCNSSNRKCWCHFLEDAKIVNIAETEGISGQFYGLKLQNRVDQITCMRLLWEPSVHFGKSIGSDSSPNKRQ